LTERVFLLAVVDIMIIVNNGIPPWRILLLCVVVPVLRVFHPASKSTDTVKRKSKFPNFSVETLVKDLGTSRPPFVSFVAKFERPSAIFFLWEMEKYI